MEVKRWMKYLLCASLAIFMIGCYSSKFNSNSNLSYDEDIVIPTVHHIKKPLSSKKAIKKRIIREATNQGLSPILALSVAKQESNFEKKAKSYVGAVGLFQIMPSTAKSLGINPYYPEENIKGGIRYLKALKDQFGSTKLALAAYNAGPGNVIRYGGVPPFAETQNYVKNIMGYYKYYKENPDSVMVE